MEEQRKALEIGALESMTCLLQGPLHNARNQVSFDLKSILVWLDSIYSNPLEQVHGIAGKALAALIKYNFTHAQLISDLTDSCWSKHGTLFRGFMNALTSMLKNDDFILQCGPHKLLCLALFKLADEDLGVRLSAVSLIHSFHYVLPKEAQEEDTTAYEASAAGSSLPMLYKSAQSVISARFASIYPEMSYEV